MMKSIYFSMLKRYRHMWTLKAWYKDAIDWAPKAYHGMLLKVTKWCVMMFHDKCIFIHSMISRYTSL